MYSMGDKGKALRNLLINCELNEEWAHLDTDIWVSDFIIIIYIQCIRHI